MLPWKSLAWGSAWDRLMTLPAVGGRDCAKEDGDDLVRGGSSDVPRSRVGILEDVFSVHRKGLAPSDWFL